MKHYEIVLSPNAFIPIHADGVCYDSGILMFYVKDENGKFVYTANFNFENILGYYEVGFEVSK